MRSCLAERMSSLTWYKAHDELREDRVTKYDEPCQSRKICRIGEEKCRTFEYELKKVREGADRKEGWGRHGEASNAHDTRYDCPPFKPSLRHAGTHEGDPELSFTSFSRTTTMGIAKTIAVLLHLAGAGAMTYAWLELGQIPNNAYVVQQKGGHFQFLTIQG